MREGIHYVSQETIPASEAGVIPAKNKDLCKFWDGVLSQKPKRQLRGTGKHIAGKVGWNGAVHLDDSKFKRALGCLEYFFMF